MVKKEKTKEKQEIGEQSKDMFNVWTDNYTGLLEMCVDSNIKLYKPWIESVRDLAEKAGSISQESVPEKYKEFYDMWMASYEKMFNDFIALPAMKRTRENNVNFTGMPDIYSETYRQLTKLQKDSYARLYMP
jgi:hypothetical protein